MQTGTDTPVRRIPRLDPLKTLNNFYVLVGEVIGAWLRARRMPGRWSRVRRPARTRLAINATRSVVIAGRLARTQPENLLRLSALSPGRWFDSRLGSEGKRRLRTSGLLRHRRQSKSRIAECSFQ